MNVRRRFATAGLVVGTGFGCAPLPGPTETASPPPTPTPPGPNISCQASALTFSVRMDFGFELPLSATVSGAGLSDDRVAVIEFDVAALAGVTPGGHGTLSYSTFANPALVDPGAVLNIDGGFYEGSGEGSEAIYFRFVGTEGVLVEGGSDVSGQGPSDIGGLLQAGRVDDPCRVGFAVPSEAGGVPTGNPVRLDIDAHESLIVGDALIEAVAIGGGVGTTVIPEDCGNDCSPGTYTNVFQAGYAYRRAP